MNAKRLVFAQLIAHLPFAIFRRGVAAYDGERKAQSFSCLGKLLIISVARSTLRERLSRYYRRVRTFFQPIERNVSMVTVIVKYKTPKHYTREEISAILRLGAENIFKGMPHLYSKQFCFDVDSREGLSVYLWDSMESATAFFNDQFLDNFKQSMGATPSVEYFDTIVTVDNRAGDITTA